MGGVTIVRSRRLDTKPYPSTKSAIHMSILESTKLSSDGRILCYGRASSGSSRCFHLARESCRPLGTKSSGLAGASRPPPLRPMRAAKWLNSGTRTPARGLPGSTACQDSLAVHACVYPRQGYNNDTRCPTEPARAERTSFGATPCEKQAQSVDQRRRQRRARRSAKDTWIPRRAAEGETRRATFHPVES